MFDYVKIPKKINSPIQEAVFEIRYNGHFPGEALYGLLFDVFAEFPNKNATELPIMQIPRQIRDTDLSLKYQPYYKADNDTFAFSVGPHSIVFSSLRPYSGWSAWSAFFIPILKKINTINIVDTVERIGLRYFDIFDSNILEQINADFSLDSQYIKENPSAFNTEFTLDNIKVILNIGNTAIINGQPTDKSLIDIDCIYNFNCNAEYFFASYKSALDEAHSVNKKVFFGLLKPELLEKFTPEF